MQRVMREWAPHPSVILSERSESKDLLLANLAEGRIVRSPRGGSVGVQRRESGAAGLPKNKVRGEAALRRSASVPAVAHFCSFRPGKGRDGPAFGGRSCPR